MKIREYDAVVVGTGAAGYNAACRIKEEGTKSVCMVTEGVNCGTSRNTGSDKQTYYKLGLAGSAPDSVRSMAQNLFEGGCVEITVYDCLMAVEILTDEGGVCGLLCLNMLNGEFAAFRCKNIVLATGGPQESTQTACIRRVTAVPRVWHLVPEHPSRI